MFAFLLLYLKIQFIKSIPTVYCSIFGYTKSKVTKGLAIFGISKKEDEWTRDWTEKLVNIITKDRKKDAGLRSSIERKLYHICELHFTEDQIICITSNTISFVYHAYFVTD